MDHNSLGRKMWHTRVGVGVFWSGWSYGSLTLASAWNL